MMDPTTAAPWVVASMAVLGFVVNTAMMIRGGGWSSAKREETLKESFKTNLDDLRSETTHNLAEINRDMNQGFAETLQRFGDTIAAIREKIHLGEVVLERDFLRKQEFYEHNRLSGVALHAMDEKIDLRLSRQDERIASVELRAASRPAH